MVLDETAMSFVTFRNCCLAWKNVARNSKQTEKIHFAKEKSGKSLTHNEMSIKQFCQCNIQQYEYALSFGKCSEMTFHHIRLSLFSLDPEASAACF